MSKSDTKSQGVALSEDSTNALAVTENRAVAVELANGDVTGQITLNLSKEMRDALAVEFLDALQQIQDGFGELTAPGDIFKMNQPFHIIDATTINDYEDRNTGEIKVKHIFRLEFSDGRVLQTMQSDARPRRVMATGFSTSRRLGTRIKAGPYKYEQKAIVGQIQPAFIFVPQPGFKVAPV
jgi:hypothetical protein